MGKMWSSADGDTHQERLFTRVLGALYKGENLGSILLRSTWRDRAIILQSEKKLMDYLSRFKELVGED